MYEAFGFAADGLIERWEGEAHNFSSSARAGFEDRLRPAIYALDRAAFGADRTRLIDCLLTDSCADPLLSLASDGELRGYVLARRGRRANYIGPLLAKDPSTALNLFEGMLAALDGERVFVDFNTGFPISPDVLAARGFTKQRDLVRMSCGRTSSAGTSDLVFAIAGPELG
jgi:hypothetical protein